MTIDLDEYRRWDALDMAELVRAGAVAATELEDACRRAMAEAEPLGAVAAVAEPAIEGAAGAGGPLAGVPFLVKELLAVPGLPWTMGSRLLAQADAGPPSPYVGALRHAGLRIVGATTSSEFGLLGSTETALHGATRNPWDLRLSAGGSSGGAAAAVAGGIVPLAHASDAGGSIRFPAAMTGLFGFLPSAGRTEPTGPDLGGLASLVREHAVARSVRDSAALLAATERRGPGAVHPPIGQVREPSLRRLRFAVQEHTLAGALPHPEVLAALHRGAALLEDLGHERVDAPMAALDSTALARAFFGAAARTMAGVAAMVTPMLGRAPGADELEPFTLELIEWSSTLPPTAEAEDSSAFAAATAAHLHRFERCDVVLSPTVAEPPWPLGTLAPDLGREELIERTIRLIGYTPIHNIAGSPAMSVPLESADDGRPIGLHLAAAPGDDALLLALAFELEAARPWIDRLPCRAVR